MFWVIIAIAIVYFLRSYLKDKQDQMEERVFIIQSIALSKSHLGYHIHENIYRAAQNMQINYVHAIPKVDKKERQNVKFQYIEFLRGLALKRGATDKFDVNLEDDAVDDYTESHQQAKEIMEPIEQYFKSILGDKYIGIDDDIFDEKYKK